jgi:hypothetical protein
MSLKYLYSIYFLNILYVLGCILHLLAVTEIFLHTYLYTYEYRGRILGQNLDKSFKSFPRCYSQSSLQLCSWDFYFFKFTQPLTISTVQVLNTLKEKWGKPDRKPYPLAYGLRNPCRTLKSENSQHLCPETSTKFYVHEFSTHMQIQIIYTLGN